MEAYFAEDEAANEGIEALLGFQDLNHVFAGQGFGPHDQQLQQAMAFMLNSGGGVKQSNSPPESPSRSHTDSPLSSLLHKVEHLQGLLLQLVAQAGFNNQRMATATTGIEKLVDQLMGVAKGMLVQQQQQQQAMLLPSGNASAAAAAFNEHYSSSSSNPFVEDIGLDFARDFAATELVAEQLQQEKQYVSYLASLADEVQDPVLLAVAGPAAAAAAAAAKEEEEEAEGDSLPPGSYDLIELDAMEILAEHTHFCEICGKGFKRDANLRMHMRGHGDEYKTAAALARPDKAAHESQQQQEETTKRYSCPFVGCKRNKLHAKFVPLKTVLCVKNHYRRTHCPKMLTCSKCRAKRFSVVADLRTHEKHCGREKWQCSCGTTFSRKDKLLGHLGLFLGHKPVMPGSPPALRFGPPPAPRLRFNGVQQQQLVQAGNSSSSAVSEEAVVSW